MQTIHYRTTGWFEYTLTISLYFHTSITWYILSGEQICMEYAPPVRIIIPIGPMVNVSASADNFMIRFMGEQFHKMTHVQYIPRNMHTVFASLCFVVVIHWLIFPYPPGLLRWHCGNLTIAPVPAKQPGWIWINTLCEIIMNDYITTTKQSTKNRVPIYWDIL